MPELEAQGRDLTPALQMKVEQAAQLQAFAEAARGRFLRGESSDRIDGICTAERLAERAIRALRLADAPPKPVPENPLMAHFTGGGAE